MNKKRKKQLLFVFITFLLLSAVVRMVYPSADAPFDLSWSQGPSTDGFYYIAPAIDFVKGGELKPISKIWDAPGYYLLYLPFLYLFGAGFAQLNLITAIISLFGFVFFFLIVKDLLDLSKEEGDVKIALFASVFWAFTYFFVMYNRIPLIYTTMVFYMLVAAWFWFLGTKRPLFFIFAWITVFFAIFYVRVIAVALIPPFLVGHLLLLLGDKEMGGSKTTKAVMLSVVAGIVLVVFLGWFFEFAPLDTAIARVKTHLKENVFGRGLLVYLFNLGDSGGIIQRLPVVSLLAYSYIIIFVRDVFLKRLDFSEGTDVMKVVILAWAVFGAFYTILFKYAPPRYFLFLMPPLFILAGMTSARLLSPREKGEFGYSYYFMLLFWLLFLTFRMLVMIVSYSMNNFATFAMGFELSATAVERFDTLIKFFSSFYLLLTMSLLISLLIMVTIYLIDNAGKSKKGKFAIRGGIRYAFVAVAMMCFFYYQGILYWGWVGQPYYTTTNASKELTRLVGEGALLAGVYAHPLTIENDLKHTYMNFTNPKSKPPCKRFKDRKATHLLIDSKNGLVYIQEFFPETFDCLDLIETFYVRGNAIELYRYENSSGYSLTDFEQAKVLMIAEEFEDAKDLLLGTIKEGTPSSVEYTSLGRCLLMLNDLEGAEEALKTALEINPDNLTAHWGMARTLEIKGDKAGALSHYRLVHNLYPESKRIREIIRELIFEK